MRPADLHSRLGGGSQIKKTPCLLLLPLTLASGFWVTFNWSSPHTPLPHWKKVKVKSLSLVRLFTTPWTVAYQAPWSMGFSRQEYWSGLPFPFPGDLPNPGIEPRSPALQTDALLSEPLGKLFPTAAAAAAKSRQSYPTLWDPRDGSPPGSPIPWILQERTLAWVAISFSNAWKWKVKVKSLSRVWLLATPWTAAYRAPPSMGFSRQEYWSWVPLPSPLLTSKYRK